MHRRTAFLAVLTTIIICLLISCTLVGFVQAKKVDSPDGGIDVKGEKASENQLIKVTAAEAAVGTATVITWDENKIIVNYNVDGATCAQGCFLKILHDDYGYPICWFDFDISDKLKGTIETAPIETRMEIKRYTWYVTIEPKENRMIEFDDPSKIKLPPIFKLTADKMPKSITADPRYKT